WQDYVDETILLVNTTPLGMEPNIERSPVKEAEKSLLSDKICYDIVYTPFKTVFLQRAEKTRATTINELDMFIQQGNRSFELWTSKTYQVEQIHKELLKILSNGH